MSGLFTGPNVLQMVCPAVPPGKGRSCIQMTLYPIRLLPVVPRSPGKVYVREKLLVLGACVALKLNAAGAALVHPLVTNALQVALHASVPASNPIEGVEQVFPPRALPSQTSGGLMTLAPAPTPHKLAGPGPPPPGPTAPVNAVLTWVWLYQYYH